MANINTIDEANAFLERYLPVYAERFAVTASKIGDLHRPIPRGIDLDRILCVKTERALRNDFTIAHDKKLYQILDNTPAKKVIVEERVNGSMVVRYKDIGLRFKEITAKPAKKPYVFKIRKAYVPPADHPWKSFKISPYSSQYSQREKVAPKEKELLLTK